MRTNASEKAGRGDANIDSFFFLATNDRAQAACRFHGTNTKTTQIHSMQVVNFAHAGLCIHESVSLYKFQVVVRA
jgi:hypothetical protein